MYDRISIGRYGFYKTNRKLSPLFPEQKRFVITARKSAEYRGFSPAQADTQFPGDLLTTTGF